MYKFCPTYAKAIFDEAGLKDIYDRQVVINPLSFRCMVKDHLPSSSIDLHWPEIKTDGSSGADIHASAYFEPGSDEPLESYDLKPGKMVIVGTGIHVEIPKNLEIQVRGRSGLAFKHGISVVHGVGTVDSDYRGEIKVALINHGSKSVKLQRNERVAQMVAAIVIPVKYTPANSLSDTDRGNGGFGSTGR